MNTESINLYTLQLIGAKYAFLCKLRTPILVSGVEPPREQGGLPGPCMYETKAEAESVLEEYRKTQGTTDVAEIKQVPDEETYYVVLEK